MERLNQHGLGGTPEDQPDSGKTEHERGLVVASREVGNLQEAVQKYQDQGYKLDSGPLEIEILERRIAALEDGKGNWIILVEHMNKNKKSP